MPSSHQQRYQQDEELSIGDYSTVEDDLSSSRDGANSSSGWMRFSRFLLLSVVASMAVVFALVAVNGTGSATQFFSDLATTYSGTLTPLTETEAVLDVTITNADYGTPPSQSLLPWDFVVEPHKTQTMTASIEGTEWDWDYTWDLSGVSASGQTISFIPTATGVYTYTVTATHTGDVTTVYKKEFSVAVKYIRREIRTLTDADRTKFFNALMTLYTTDQTTGEALYGSKYRSAEYLLYKHLNGAGTTDCDHWHDGAGLITHHAAFTLECEQSLQSIDPSISMPYWEYAIDAELYNDYDWVTSPIFNDDWFGASSPPNDDHIITDGMWAGISMPSGEPYKEWSVSETGSLNPFVNAYGYLRSPWNNNPSPYFGRCNTSYGTYSSMTALGRCSCTAMSECYASPSLAAMNDCMNGYTHGVVHILIGGAWGEGDVFDEYERRRLARKSSRMDTLPAPAGASSSATGASTTTTGASTTAGSATTTTTSAASAPLTTGTTTAASSASAPSTTTSSSASTTTTTAAAAATTTTSASSATSPVTTTTTSTTGLSGSSSTSSSSSGAMSLDIPSVVDTDIPDVNGPPDVAEVETSIISFKGNMKLLLFKMLWRMGWSRCPDSCDIESGESCECSVPQEYIDTYGGRYILDSSGVLTAAARYIASDATDEDCEDIIKVIESPGVAGEMFTSAAPFDPTFWPLHGSIERMLGLKRIKLSKGEITSDDFDETWGYDTDNYLYLVGICDWSNVQSSSDLTIPTCNMSVSNICPGHHENDVLEFTDFQGKGETYTNAELYTFIHPYNDDLPYCYDDYTYDYCYDYYDEDELEFWNI